MAVEQLKPLFKKSAIINIELRRIQNETHNWGLDFSIRFQNDAFDTSLKDLITDKEVYNKKFLAVIIEREQFIKMVRESIELGAFVFPPLFKMVADESVYSLPLKREDATLFLDVKKTLKKIGFNVISPEHLYNDIEIPTERSKMSIELSLGNTNTTSKFDLKSLLSFRWQITVDGDLMTKEELRELIEVENPLVRWKDKWIFISDKERNALKFILKSETKKMSRKKALKLALVGTAFVKGIKCEVTSKGDFGNVVDCIKSMEAFHNLPTPLGFNGTLRPYQIDGFSWLFNMTDMGLGICLADDMGLGKTIQVIAFLLHRKMLRPDELGSVLIICPTSVLFNWKKEIEKFAPDLMVFIHHGEKRREKMKHKYKYNITHQVILTTYGTLRNDIEFFKRIHFSGIILDESQNVKSHQTKKAKAIKKLQSEYKIALSGTPIENRLMELWSLFNFLNPNFLGSREYFKKTYATPIEKHKKDRPLEQLKTIISPFILRRLKTDKSIIDNLPPKNEIKVFVKLTPNQANLYQELVDETLHIIKNSDDSSKRGLVFKLITQLKQLCNHPFQYLKMDANTYDFKNNIKEFLRQSKKTRRLIEIIDEVLDNNEKILIFTQFRQMGDLLINALEYLYNTKVLYFHGSVPEKKRRKIISEFQSEDEDSPKIMVISLKAGGTGINLTQGTTVVHYDRWWNPAVEDQATDRTYRIGQDSRVNVYKFVTLGTIEEKVDKLLEEKRELTSKIIATSGESWISDMDFEKLKELFTMEKNGF